MITDLKTLIDTCKQELHDREYHAHHADILIKEWDAVLQWFSHRGVSEFGQDIGYKYCDEEIGSHIIVKGMSSRQKNGSGPSGCCSLISRLAILSSGHPVSNGLMMVKPDSSFSSFFSTNA